jgi:hypothetical protein
MGIWNRPASGPFIHTCSKSQHPSVVLPTFSGLHHHIIETKLRVAISLGMDLAVDDRQGGASTAKEERERSDETVTSDLIIDLINKHLVNETLDPSMPLTESELLG